jgi:GDP-4-dehydro-6-deoxy-D-mannose reductase
MDRILVTGGGGFAGRHLLRLLAEGGSGRVAATHLGDGLVRGDGLDDASIEWHSMDLADQRSIDEVVERTEPGFVYHLAGQASVGESLRSPLRTWDANATGTVRLLDSLARAKVDSCKVVLISSAEVYGAVPVERQPITETEKLDPTTPYGASKAAAEIAALQFATATRIEVVVARAFNHIGPGQDERFVLPSMAAQLRRIREGHGGRELRVGNLDVYRDFLDVRDVVRAYRILMERAASGETYNVCSGTAYSLRDIVGQMVELSGAGATIEVDPARVRPADIPRLRGDAAKLEALGWQPSIPIDRTLSDLLDSVT